MSKPLLLVACGNEWMGDDGFALQVARAVAALAPPEVEVLEVGIHPVDLLAALSGRQALLVVDAAVAPDRPAGELLDIDFLSPDRPALLVERAVSTHGLGVGQQLALAQTLNLLPAQVRLVALTIDSPQAERELSTGTAAQIPRAVERVVQWARRGGGPA